MRQQTLVSRENDPANPAVVTVGPKSELVVARRSKVAPVAWASCSSRAGMCGAMDLPVDRSVPVSVVAKRAANTFLWILGLFAAVWLVGFVLSVPLFVFL